MLRWAVIIAVVPGCDLVFPPGGAPGVDGDPAKLDAAGDAQANGDGAEVDAAVDAQPTADAIGPATCPIGYTPFGTTGTSYRHDAQPVTWSEAIVKCTDDQVAGSSLYTHLVVLDDNGERDTMHQTFPDEASWIGLSDRRVAGLFVTVTTQAPSFPPLTQPPWALNQPDDGGPGGPQDCVRILGWNGSEPGLLDDDDCGFPYGYICECDAFPPDPTKY